MTKRLHGDLAAGRWCELSVCVQLGHVGSEVSRAMKWQDRNPRLAAGALDRDLDLLALTLDDPRPRRSACRLREIARVREVLLDLLAGGNTLGTDPQALQRYFDAFAMAASRGG